MLYSQMKTILQTQLHRNLSKLGACMVFKSDAGTKSIQRYTPIHCLNRDWKLWFFCVIGPRKLSPIWLTLLGVYIPLKPELNLQVTLLFDSIRITCCLGSSDQLAK